MYKYKKQETLKEPIKMNSIPQNSQWLAGEGAGSWFHIETRNEGFIINRFSPQGKIECTGFFIVSNNQTFNINIPFKFIHLSHCRTVKISQYNIVFIFERIELK